MTNIALSELLDLAEAVARGDLQAADAERQLRARAGSGPASDKAVRELRGLILATGAVRSHAQATRDAAASGSVAATHADEAIGTVVAGPVAAGSARRHPSNGGSGQPRRRTWLLAVAVLVVGTGVIGATLVGGGLTAPTSAPTNLVAVSSLTVTPTLEASDTSTVTAPRSASWTAAPSVNWPARVATRLLDGRVLAIGGWSGGPGGCNCSAQLYDPATGTWTAAADMLGEGGEWVATLLPSGKVLVAGGDAGRAQLFDPVTNAWTATGTMVVNRQGATATLLPDGKVLVAGGHSVRSNDSRLELISAEVYDPATGAWTATGDMLQIGMVAATLLANGKVLVLAGVNSPTLGLAELYDPVKGTWSATGSMRVDRAGFETALLANGDVLVVGGTGSASSRNALASAELYDPATGAWTLTGGMAHARMSFTATTLLDGRVLVAGGWESQGSGLWGPPRSAELYDPATGAWTATASVVTPRAGGSATLLLDGRVLVVGGDGGDGPDGGSLASADLYDPGP